MTTPAGASDVVLPGRTRCGAYGWSGPADAEILIQPWLHPPGRWRSSGGQGGGVTLRAMIAEPAVRSYRDEPVPVELVRRLVDQARWTGSARNRQPWRFAAVYEPAVRTGLARLGEYAGHLAAAPVVLLLLSPVERRLDTEFDVGRAAQSITIVATAMGLGSCIVSLYPEDNAHRAAALVRAEPGWAARHAITLGYSATKPTGRRTIPAGRHPTDELLRFH